MDSLQKKNEADEKFVETLLINDIIAWSNENNIYDIKSVQNKFEIYNSDLVLKVQNRLYYHRDKRGKV